MPFAADRFEAAKFEPRRTRVPVPALASFFDEGEPAEWEVRGLNSVELHRAIDASNRQSSIESIVRAIAAKGDQADAVRRALGLTKDTPGEIAKRLEMLVAGSVAPTITLPVAVKMAEAFPIEFLMLTNEISALTGKGADLVKPEAASPTTQDSCQP
jgi:hypothetical protein